MTDKKELIKHFQSFINDKRLLKAFESVPRENFISDKKHAYGDFALPIGFGQTISQPTTVMIMTQALELKKGLKILEIGSGSGYQTALISKIIGLSGKIYTTEIIPELANVAKTNLKYYRNIEVLNYDGSIGHEQKAPFDRIIITAACPSIPQPLIEQLDNNGILVAPVGSLTGGQEMVKLRKPGLKQEFLGRFVFVPLKGKHGY
ncbi:MAG: protein-L-isoaspartate(D-aspartate) O-methyltransferase [Nanoarchaeota archaeon]